ncbi:mask [Symbiodinium sp. CCMP2592]|nr:mask [Symbiodinium sp. CCMP2592]
MTADALQVRVLRLTGEPVELAVASEATVHELKLLLNETCDVPYFCQKVMLGHALLQATDALSSLPFPISLTLVVDSFHPEVAPALQEAARHGDLRAVEKALSAPADPNQADEHGWTPLIMAAHAGHGEVLRLLHRASANLETTTPHRRTPFFVACQRGHVEAARVLCELGANKEKARTGGYTPLLIACREGHAPVVKLLCEMRADKEHAAMHGWTPLLLAARHGHNAVTKARLVNECL